MSIEPPQRPRQPADDRVSRRPRAATTASRPSTTRRSSTTPAGSASSPTPAAGASPGPAARSRRSRGARPPRRVRRRRRLVATGPGSRCRSIRPSSRRSLRAPVSPASGRPSSSFPAADGRGARGRRGPARSSADRSPPPASTIARWRTVPTDPAALGGAARGMPAGLRPGVRHAARSTRRGRPPDRRRLRAPRSSSPAAGSRPRPGRRVSATSSPSRPPRAGRSSTRASSPAPASPTSTPTCAIRRSASAYAIFHQRYATNTQPTWRLAQPFRAIAHNGEINTVRGNRSQVRGRAGDPAESASPRELTAAGPLSRRRRLRLAVPRRAASSCSSRPAGTSGRRS